MMNAQEIIHYIATAEKKTPVKITLREKAGEAPISFGSAKVFGVGDKVIFGDWKELGPILEANRSKIDDMVIENDCRNSAIPLLDLKGINARIEPGAVIRDQVSIGDGAVIMMEYMLKYGLRYFGVASLNEALELRRPIYRQLAAYGHIGREDLGVNWEKTDRTEALKAALQ